MTNNARPPVTETEIEAAEDLSAAHEFTASLRLLEELLERTEDTGLRMRLIFDVVHCASMLNLADIRDRALRELDALPNPEESRVLANINRAYAERELGRPADAIRIIDANLETGFFDRDDWKIHRYRCLFIKGISLTLLKQPHEGLDCLDAAHSLYPDEASTRDETERHIFRWAEPSLQIERANCFVSLDRYEESYLAAQKVLEFDAGDLSVLALQYMAECRLQQTRIQDALQLYSEIKKRLPCRLVDEARVDQGITNCMDYLEKLRPAGRPS